MAERSIDRVLIELRPETIALPWSSRPSNSTSSARPGT